MAALVQPDDHLGHHKWKRFEPESPLPELVKTVPHVAFEVDDLESELEGKDVLIEPNSPAPGIVVAFVGDDRAPVEFIQLLEALPDAD